MRNPFQKRLSRQDVAALEEQLQGRDVIAERNPERPVYHGTHEDIENALVPWLRARRSRSRRKSRRTIF